MLKYIASAAFAFLAGVALAQPIPAGGGSSPPYLNIACGSDGTAVIQAALNANGSATLPPCTQVSPVYVTAALNLPSNSVLRGLGVGVSWLKEADSSNLTPMLQNANFAGGASIVLNTNITLMDFSIDGNGGSQTSSPNAKCVFLLGVSNLTIRNLEVVNCRSDAVAISGNGAAASPVLVNGLYVSGTVGATGFLGTGIGFQIGNRQRNAQVSNVFVENTFGPGVLIDASEGVWSNISVKGAGVGSTCTAASTNATVDNPGGGNQYVWAPCAPGIWVRNVTDVVATNLSARQGQYYGIIVSGARHTTLANLLATNNSQKTLGSWDDLHLDLNTFSTGYGENHALTINGATVGSNAQSGSFGLDVSPPTARYGLFISDGLAGSIGDMTLVSGGTGYTVNDLLTLSGGTSSVAVKVNVATAPSGVVATLFHNYTGGAGTYTVLPSNPVSVTGGTGSGATFKAAWSSANVSNVVIGQTLTGPTRLPSFITGWTVVTTGP